MSSYVGRSKREQRGVRTLPQLMVSKPMVEDVGLVVHSVCHHRKLKPSSTTFPTFSTAYLVVDISTTILFVRTNHCTLNYKGFS